LSGRPQVRYDLTGFKGNFALSQQESVMSDRSREAAVVAEKERSALPKLERLWAAKESIVLTVNGTEFHISDEDSFRQLLDLIDRIEAIDGIRTGLEEMQRGEGRPLDEVFAELRRKHGLSD
jgi:hypothetical protein